MPHVIFDPFNHEHVARLAAALGATRVDIIIGKPVIGAPGQFDNVWYARFTDCEYGASCPTQMGMSTERAQCVMAKHMFDTIMSHVAAGTLGKR